MDAQLGLGRLGLDYGRLAWLREAGPGIEKSSSERGIGRLIF